MDFLFTSGVQKSPVKGGLYGVPGVGKTTVCQHLPAPLFIDLEGGSQQLNVTRTKHISSLDEFRQIISFLTKENKGKFKSVIIDTLDVLEQLIWKDICDNLKCSSIESPGYGKGYAIANEYFNKILDALDKTGLHYVLIGHHIVRTINDVATEPYDSYNLRINPKAAGTIYGRLDFLFFCEFEKAKAAKDKISYTGKRVAHTVETGAFLAKNRFNLPQKLEINDKLFSFIKE